MFSDSDCMQVVAAALHCILNAIGGCAECLNGQPELLCYTSILIGTHDE